MHSAGVSSRECIGYWVNTTGLSRPTIPLGSLVLVKEGSGDSSDATLFNAAVIITIMLINLLDVIVHTETCMWR